jgi:hypothetical protein
MRVKRLRREAVNSHPSFTDTKNKWSYTAVPPTCPHGWYRGDFTVFTLSNAKASLLEQFSLSKTKRNVLYM